MTEYVYTDTVPTAPGWYFCLTSIGEPEIVEIVAIANELRVYRRGDDVGLAMNLFAWEWAPTFAGPIRFPEVSDGQS